MRLWRVSRHTDLTGTGGLVADGRWHARGTPVVYTAEHAALAILETIVQLRIDGSEYPEGYHLLEIDVPDRLRLEQIRREDLPGNWTRDDKATRSIGDAWLASSRSVLLEVPSVVAPASHNLLINPRHPHATRLRIVRTITDPFDPRLFSSPP